MANLRAAQKQMTRRLLLDSALDLFQENGYAPTTIDEIASRAGTTRVTFYAYFPSKTELVRALIDDRLNEVLHRRSTHEGHSTAPALVEVVAAGTREQIGSWIRTTAENWPNVRPLIQVGRDAAAVDRALVAVVDTWMEDAIGDIERGLEEAGRFEPDTRHFRGVLAMGQFDYVAQHWADHADRWAIEQDRMLDLLTDAWMSVLAE